MNREYRLIDQYGDIGGPYDNLEQAKDAQWWLNENDSPFQYRIQTRELPDWEDYK